MRDAPVTVECDEPYITTMNDSPVAGKKISVIGAARSGVAVANLLVKLGARVFVSDSAGPDKLGENIQRLSSAGIAFETGGHTAKALDADILVVSPGVPSSAAII